MSVAGNHAFLREFRHSTRPCLHSATANGLVLLIPPADINDFEHKDKREKSLSAKGNPVEQQNSHIQNEEKFVEENERAEQHISANDLASAARILVDIVEKDPGNWRAFNNMGIISWSRSAWEDAFTTFKRACALKPDYVDALVNLFDACLKLRRAAEVLPVYKKALEVDPDIEEARVLAEAIEEQGDDIYVSQRALAIGIHNPKIEEADKLLKDGKCNDAMRAYLDVNDSEGPNADAFCGLGVVSFYQERYKDAFSLFLEAIKLNPINTDTFLNLLDAARECGRVDDACRIYDLYAKEFPGVLDGISHEFKNVATADPQA